MTENEEKVEEKIEATPKPTKSRKKVVISPERVASRQRAHDIKVAKFLAGGKF